MEFEGVVVQVLPVARGTSARGEWVKQEVIFEQQGEYGRKICVSFWGDRADEATRLSPGEPVSVAANVESREYNGRWYTEVRAWKLERRGSSQPPVRNAAPDEQLPPLTSSEEPLSSGSAEEYDDLPF